MSTAMTLHEPLASDTLAKVLLDGNLAGLNSGQRVDYMTRVCETLGLNPLTKPFEFLTFQGKMVMYARRDCTEQLRKIHGVSVTISSREVVEGCYIVTAKAQDARGRCDESIGAVPIEGLKGEIRSNAMMKAETKAKRRVTLSICGLGMLDESETESFPGAHVAQDYTPPAAKEEAKASAPQGPTTVTTASRPGPQTTTGAAPGTSTTEASGKDYINANKVPVKAGDPVAKPAQVARIEQLRSQCLDEQSFKLDWLGPYKRHDGAKCAGPGELTFDQAANLIKRMTAHAQRQGQRMERNDAEVAANLGAVVGNGIGNGHASPSLESALTKTFRFPDDEKTFLRELFGKPSVRELDQDDCETALALLMAGYGSPEYSDLLAKCKALGRVL